MTAGLADPVLAQPVSSGQVLSAPARKASPAGDDAARETLRRDLRAWVAQQSGQPPARVAVAPLDHRLRVSTCPAGMRFDYPFTSRDVVRARCDTPAWEVYVRIELRVTSSLVHAARPLAAGQIIEAVDLELRPADADLPGAFQDIGQVAGRLLRRNLEPGMPVQAGDLQEAQKVLRLTAPLRADSPIDASVYRIEVLPRALVPAGAAPGAAPATGARLVRDLPAGHVLLASDIASARRLLVARDNLPSGKRIEPGDFELRLVTLRDASQSHFADYSGLEHMELTRHMRSGEALIASDLRPAWVVLRGQPVLLTLSNSAGMAVTVRVEAMQDGRMGEQIRLRNPESGRILSGVVTGPNAVRGL